MSPFASLSLRALGAACLLALVACDSLTDPTPASGSGLRGVVVLNGYGLPGVTLVPDSGTATTRIDFGPTFDGAGMALLRDSVLATSSKDKGDLLFVTDLVAGSVLRVQMPAASNPAGAAFAAGLGGGNVVVALRDAGAIAVVRASGTSGSVVTTLANAGRCPSDVAAQGDQFWVVDANERCGAGGDYATLGPSRLIRVPTSGATRDTIVLGVQGATSMKVLGSVAYVASGGVADFSRYPNTTFTSPGSITMVDLTARKVTTTASLPAGSYGAGLRVGGDGNLYVTAYTSTDFSKQDVFAFTPALVPTGVRAAGKQSLDLRRADGSAPVCAAATADARGRVYCVTNGVASAATLVTFGPDGRELRAVPAGQGGVDVAVR